MLYIERVTDSNMDQMCSHLIYRHPRGFPAYVIWKLKLLVLILSVVSCFPHFETLTSRTCTSFVTSILNCTRCQVLDV
jgi:hypothetical protein